MTSSLLPTMLVIGAFVLVVGAVPDSCKSNYMLYKELGCSPMELDSSGCPSYYDCGDYEKRQNNKCYFKNETVDIGARLTEDKTQMLGRASCFCEADSSGKGRPYFVCAQIECPSLWNHEEYGCFWTYSPGSYCETSSTCGSTEGKKTCVHNGKTHQLGMRFDVGSHTCVCTEQYDPANPVTESTCHEGECGFQLTSDLKDGNCVPIFYNDVDGCAYDYKCSDSTSGVVVVGADGQKRSQTVKTSDKCKFGDLVLGKGDRLQWPTKESTSKVIKEDRVECTCNIPPMVTCVRQESQPSAGAQLTIVPINSGKTRN